MVDRSVRCGAEMRKRVRKIEKMKSGKHVCHTCGKKMAKRISNSIWKCRSCGSVFAGGSYSLSTPTGSAGKRIVDVKAQRGG
ncbi:MAG: 50S ribosomal protein L37ae [Candidatus Micrarchaeota archaeon]